jgi:hypothetical protein
MRMDERILLAVEKAKEEVNSQTVDLLVLGLYVDAA